VSSSCDEELTAREGGGLNEMREPGCSDSPVGSNGESEELNASVESAPLGVVASGGDSWDSGKDASLGEGVGGVSEKNE
jgi:hypothetical protein